jgi:hypothetical protein
MVRDVLLAEIHIFEAIVIFGQVSSFFREIWGTILRITEEIGII